MRGRYLSGLLALILLTAAASAQEKREPEISIALMARNQKVIPIYYKLAGYWTSNIKLPAITIANNSRETAQILSITIIGKAAGRELVRHQLYRDSVDASIATVNPKINKLIANSSPGLGINYGDVAILDRTYQEQNRLGPSEITCVRLSDMMYLVCQGRAKLDDVRLDLRVALGDTEKTFEVPLPLTPYVCKGNYIFPIRGSTVTVNLPLSLSHREAFSQEFAIDIGDARQGESGEFVDPWNLSRVEDSLVFHRNVLAIGDGVVAACGNGYPDSLAEKPDEYSMERMREVATRLKKEGVEYLNILCGNYVIIDHLNGEFSAYCHLSQGTIAVKAGEAVKQGQVIAKVGNTGNSSAPHLHFQLMDSPDFTKANGLPFLTRASPAEPALDEMEVEEANAPLYSDVLLMYVK